MTWINKILLDSISIINGIHVRDSIRLWTKYSSRLHNAIPNTYIVENIMLIYLMSWGFRASIIYWPNYSSECVNNRGWSCIELQLNKTKKDKYIDALYRLEWSLVVNSSNVWNIDRLKKRYANPDLLFSHLSIILYFWMDIDQRQPLTSSQCKSIMHFTSLFKLWSGIVQSKLSVITCGSDDILTLNTNTFKFGFEFHGNIVP